MFKGEHCLHRSKIFNSLVGMKSFWLLHSLLVFQHSFFPYHLEH
jgi:hypothetical protein